jgi:spermidine/putrescine-binding protein
MKMNKFLRKNLVLGATVLTILPSAAGCTIVRSIGCVGKETLDVFNWGEYVDPEVLTMFEQENDVCITYSLFDDNETAVTKMRLQSYDVIFPSEYAVAQLAQEGRLEKLDWSKIQPTNKAGQVYNVNFERDFIPPMMANLNALKAKTGFNYFDYAAPYFFQNMTLVYNSKVITEAEMIAQQWNILSNPKYKVAIRNSSRDTFMYALKQLGYSANTNNAAQIAEAEAYLKNQKTVMGNNIAYLTDEVLDDIPAEVYDVGIVFSGDAFSIMDANENIKFYTPTKGTNIAIDGMVIPTNAENKEMAYKFISHFLSYEIAKLNTEYVWYTTPLNEVYQDFMSDLLAEGRPQRFVDVYTVISTALDEVYTYDTSTKELIENAYNRVKAS